MTNPLKDNAVPRRSFLRGALALLAAPLLPKAVVAAIEPPLSPNVALAVSFADVKARAAGCQLAQIRDLLMPGVRQMVSTYEVPPAEWERIFGA
jgi:hypothetical protein